jgi:hypothetical protein
MNYALSFTADVQKVMKSALEGHYNDK